MYRFRNQYLKSNRNKVATLLVVLLLVTSVQLTSDMMAAIERVREASRGSVAGAANPPVSEQAGGLQVQEQSRRKPEQRRRNEARDQIDRRRGIVAKEFINGVYERARFVPAAAALKVMLINRQTPPRSPDHQQASEIDRITGEPADGAQALEDYLNTEPEEASLEEADMRSGGFRQPDDIEVIVEPQSRFAFALLSDDPIDCESVRSSQRRRPDHEDRGCSELLRDWLSWSSSNDDNNNNKARDINNNKLVQERAGWPPEERRSRDALADCLLDDFYRREQRRLKRASMLRPKISFSRRILKKVTPTRVLIGAHVGAYAYRKLTAPSEATNTTSTSLLVSTSTVAAVQPPALVNSSLAMSANVTL